MDANRVPTVYALTDANYSSNPVGTPYQYTVTNGADKYNTYEMMYDPVTATVDVWINGVERISNYPGNNVFSYNFARANKSVAVFFGSGSSAGIAKTNYGDISLTLNNSSCVDPVSPPIVNAQV